MVKIRKKLFKKRWTAVLMIAICLIFVVGGVFSGLSVVVKNKMYKENMTYATSVQYIGSKVTPEIDAETGYWTFTTDEDFRILHLTDTHITAGAFTAKNDRKALECVVTLIERTRPDFIVITGDMVYAMAIQTGSSDHVKPAQLLCALLEEVGIPYAVVLGNHDSSLAESGRQSRKEIAKIYESKPNCLFMVGPDDVDGYGNYVINVKNTSGKIVQSLFFFDTHSYKKGSFMLKYENIKQSQVDWYKSEVNSLRAINDGELLSLAFIHIPLKEYEDAWVEYRTYGNTENVMHIYGFSDEKDEHVLAGDGKDMLFETMLDLNSTQGIFCGHDHLNYYALNYKGIQLTYGMSSTYTAFVSVAKKTDQRGGTLITIAPDGSFSTKQEKLAI